jgi:hypothetical protein
VLDGLEERDAFRLQGRRMRRRLQRRRMRRRPQRRRVRRDAVGSGSVSVALLTLRAPARNRCVSVHSSASTS